MSFRCMSIQEHISFIAIGQKVEILNPSVPNLIKAKQYHKSQKFGQIDSSNEKILKKLVAINQRKPQHSMSSPNLSLPPIKKNQYQIPLHQESNNLIAKKIISSKPSISANDLLRGYRTIQQRRRRISKYENAGSGVSINKKKYIAELLFLKKLKGSRVLNPEP